MSEVAEAHYITSYNNTNLFPLHINANIIFRIRKSIGTRPEFEPTTFGSKVEAPRPTQLSQIKDKTLIKIRYKIVTLYFDCPGRQCTKVVEFIKFA